MNEKITNDSIVFPSTGQRVFAAYFELTLYQLVWMMLPTIYYSEDPYWGKQFGWVWTAVYFVYFVIGNSYLAKGRTLGKWWAGIATVDGAGNYLSIKASFLRSLIAFIPFILINSEAQTRLPDILIMCVFSALFFGTAYSMIFSNTRQAIHDLLVGSYVVRFAELDHFPTEPPVMKRVHTKTLVELFLLIFACSLVSSIFALLPQILSWFE